MAYNYNGMDIRSSGSESGDEPTQTIFEGPLQLVQFLRRNDFDESLELKLDSKVLESVLSTCGERKVCVVTVTGHARSGKSFLLNRIKESLQLAEKGNSNKNASSFHSNHGYKPCTKGIWIWSRAFLVDGEDEDELAVLLLDCQGFHDEFTKKDEILAVLGLSVLTSSIVVVNLTGDLTEEPFQWLDNICDYGNFCQARGIRNPFQKLSFLVRDWTKVSECQYGSKSGNKLLAKMMKLNDKKLENYFEELDCFLLPHIGSKANMQDQEFSRRLQTYIKNNFHPDKLPMKKTMGNQLSSEQFKQFMLAYVSFFGSKMEMEWGARSESIWSVTMETGGQIKIMDGVNAYVEAFKKRMNESTGEYLKETSLDGLHVQAKRRAFDAFQEFSVLEDSSRFKDELEKLLATEKEKLKKENHEIRQRVVRGQVSKADNQMRSEMEKYFPFLCENVSSGFVFYEDADFNEIVKKLCRSVEQAFLEGLPNEDEESLANLKGSLGHVLQHILDEYFQKNGNNRQQAIVAANKVTEKLKCNYVREMQELLDNCPNVEPNVLSFMHKKEMDTLMKSFQEMSIGTEDFKQKTFDGLKHEIELNYEKMECSLEWTLAKCSKAAENEAENYKADLDEKAELMETDEIQDFHREKVEAILRRFKTENPFPSDCSSGTGIYQSLKIRLEMAYVDVVQQGVLVKRDMEARLMQANENALQMYQTAVTDEMHKEEFILEDKDFDEFSEECQLKVLKTYDAEASKLDLDSEKLKEKRDQLIVQLENLDESLKNDNDQRRTAATSQAENVFSTCMKTFDTNMLSAVQQSKTKEELEQDYQICMTAATQEFSTNFISRNEDLRDSYIQKIYDKAGKGFSEMEKFFNSMKQAENVGMMTAWMQVQKVYTDNLDSHFRNKVGGAFKREELKGHHEAARKLAMENVEDVRTLASAQVKDIEQRLETLFQKYQVKNDLIAKSFDGSDPAIGIDLGTTYCCVAIYQNGKVTIVRNSLGENITPSYVRLEADDDTPICGQLAKEMAYENPESTIFDAKRIIGRRMDDKKLQDDMAYWPFSVKQGERGGPKIEVHGKSFYPEEISAKLLKHLKKEAEETLGLSIKKAVITVPAYFTDGQRKATMDAGEIAGLEVLQILNEPSAAALAYRLDWFHDENARKILVYDLGGGTFDVVVLEMKMDEETKVLAIGGDDHLGGEDFDKNLMQYCAQDFETKTKINLFGDKDSPQKILRDEARRRIRRLQDQCEKAKKQLGKAARKTTVSIAALVNGHDFKVEITKKEFERMNLALFEKTLTIVDETLESAKLKKSDIHEIVLVGGSTRIPKVQEMLERHFNGKPVSQKINPDEAVAYGAAVQAAMLNAKVGEKLFSFGKIQEVTPRSLGIEVLGKQMHTIIPKNSKIPAEIKHKYFTFANWQSSAWIKIFQGENPVAAKNNLLGDFHLDGIPPALAGEESVDVTMSIDENGILRVTAVCTSTGEFESVTVKEERGRMSEEEKQILLGAVMCA